MISRSRDKLRNSKTVSKEIKEDITLELTDIMTYMAGLNSMNDNMASIKREIREVKESILEAAKAPPTASINWAAVVAMPRIQTQTHCLHYRDQEVDEENQKRQAERRLDRAKVEITLTADGAPQATQNKLSNTDYEQITAILQKVVNESTSAESSIKIGGFRILKEQRHPIHLRDSRRGRQAPKN
jgi:hypothetical protein